MYIVQYGYLGQHETDYIVQGLTKPFQLLSQFFHPERAQKVISAMPPIHIILQVYQNTKLRKLQYEHYCL